MKQVELDKMIMNEITLQEWARSKRLNLALVFTDIVDSTAIGQKLGDNEWINKLSEHFRVGREFALKHNGFVVKVIGDAFMVAFRNSTDALDFAIDFSQDTGVDFIGIRVGMHSGQVQIMDNDIYGLNVNMAARIQSSVRKEGISVSDSIKEDYIKEYGSSNSLKFRQDSRELKNFPTAKVWGATDRNLRSKYRRILRKRREILGINTQNRSIGSSNSLGSDQTANRYRLTDAPLLQKKSESDTQAETLKNIFPTFLPKKTD